MQVTARRALAFGAPALVAVIVGLNLIGTQLNDLFLRFPGVDKVLHIGFSVLLFISVHAVVARVVANSRLVTPTALLIAVFIGLVDEFMQGFAPGRNLEVHDLIADGCGFALGWVLKCASTRRVAIPVAVSALAIAGYVVQDTYSRLADYTTALRYERIHEFGRAREYYLRALSKGLRSAALYNGLAWVQIESGVGDPAQSVEYARIALTMTPDDADVLDTLGWSLHAAGRSAEALLYLERAYAMKPDMFCIHYHLGSAYLATGRPDMAKPHLEAQVVRTDTRESSLSSQLLMRMEASQ